MNERFKVLDGWRGISILSVLAAHLLPLGPKAWEMNAAAGATGMALFFILSGFLITNLLIRSPDVGSFLVRRLVRIVPLAWLSIAVTFLFIRATPDQWLSNLFFYANWPPMALTEATGHFWSLCVEVQFYLVIASLFFVMREKSLILLPFLGIGITLFRVWNGVGIAVNTYYRLDEILAGCLLAMLYHSDYDRLKAAIGKLSPVALFMLLILTAHPQSGIANYFRPYAAMTLVGSTLFAAEKGWVHSKLEGRILGFVAGISYALYIIHGILAHTWLGQGTKLEIYAKRPLLFLATFLLAYLSTTYYESYWIGLGRKMTSRSRT